MADTTSIHPLLLVVPKEANKYLKQYLKYMGNALDLQTFGFYYYNI